MMEKASNALEEIVWRWGLLRKRLPPFFSAHSSSTRRIIIVCMLSVMVSSAFSHEINLALFEIYEQEDQLQLRIQFDRYDLFSDMTSQPRKQRLTWNHATKLIMMNDYLDQHLQLMFDGQQVEISTSTVEVSDEYITVVCDLKSLVQIHELQQIELTNDALVTTVARHENIMMFDLKGKKRSFRLNRELTKTTITY